MPRQSLDGVMIDISSRADHVESMSDISLEIARDRRDRDLVSR